MWTRICLWAFLVVVVVVPAAAEKRVALLIGNSAYTSAPLANPVNDVALLQKAFTDAGFNTVIARTNLDRLAMLQALDAFQEATRDADIAVVYFSGHGLEFDGADYLIPIAAKLESDRNVKYEAIDAGDVLLALNGAKRLKLLILDACRDNPYIGSMKRIASRGLQSRGLARIETRAADTLVLYATAEGQLAWDGAGANSPFAEALARRLFVPGEDVRIAFGDIKDDVVAATRDKPTLQTPYFTGSIGGGVITLAPAVAAPPPALPKPTPLPLAAAQPAPLVADLAERQAFFAAKEIGSRGAWMRFLAAYPTGPYADEARDRLAELQGPQPAPAPVIAVAPPPVTVAEAKPVPEPKPVELAKVPPAIAEAPKPAIIEPPRPVEPDKAPEVEKKPVEVALALPPHVEPTKPAAGVEVVHVREIQTELKRLGCYSGPVDNGWSTQTGAALQDFLKFAALDYKVDVAKESDTIAPPDGLMKALRERTVRVCPLACDAMEVERDGRCVRKTCPSGEKLNAHGACVASAPPKPTQAQNHEDKPAKAKPPAQTGKCFTSNGTTFCGD
jgi:hypothetical protein